MPEVGAERVCVALDHASAAENLGLIRALSGHAAWFKVGLSQFYSPGAADVLSAVRDAGARLFLDLKLHDIPNTVAGAASALSGLRPDLLTVHASGGAAMVAAAADALSDVGTGILAVTVLTSLGRDDLDALGMTPDPALAAARLGSVALEAGAVGLVCSGHEVQGLRARFPHAQLVTPGIRPAGTAAGDQKRVMTPGAAVAAGSSMLVVGRAVYGASDPVAAFASICAEDVSPVG